MRLPLLFSIILLIAAADACADLVNIQWTNEGRFSHGAVMAPGKFIEVCGKLPAGLKVSWEFEASTPVDFNIHYHEGKDVVFPSKLSAVVMGKDVLATAVEQDYCWMWTNKAPMPTTVTVKLWR